MTFRSSPRDFGGRPLIYLDSAATSQKPAVVIEAQAEHLRKHNANVHRGVYALAQEADAAYDGARARVAAFVGGEPETTIFTKNATEAINLVAYAWGRANVRAGDAVLITQMEHHANIVPWQVLCRERGAQLRYLEVDEHGELSLEALDAELARGDVRLVAFAHVSNVLGTINPVAEMTARARAAGALTLVDGAQAVPQMPVDVAALGADFYAWTGHKALGPTGIGVLHGRARAARADGAVPDGRGHDLLGGLPVGDAGTSCRTSSRRARRRSRRRSAWARRWSTSQALGMERVRAHERSLTAYMLERLAEVPGLRVVGPPAAERRGGLASFTIEGMHPHDVAELVDRGGRVHPRGPSLRAAADAPPGRGRDGAGERGRVQRAVGHRRADRRADRGPRGVRAVTSGAPSLRSENVGIAIAIHPSQRAR